MTRAALLCALCSTSLAAPALADEPPRRLYGAPPAGPSPAAPPIEARLEYARPDGDLCPDEDKLRSSVAANIGRDPFVSTASRRMLARVVRDGAGFVASLEMVDGAGVRVWSHPVMRDADCRALVRAMGISIAVVLDPSPAARQAPHPGLTPPPAPAQAQPRRDERSTSPGARGEHPKRLKFRVGVAGGVELGHGPDPGAGMTVQAGVRWRRFSIAGEARTILPLSSASADGVQVQSKLFGGSLVPCGHLLLPLEKWNIAACGVITVGVIEARRTDLPAPWNVSGSGVYSGAGARLSLEIPVGGPFALRITGETLATIKPVTIQTEHGLVTVMTTSPVTGSIGGGVVADFDLF